MQDLNSHLESLRTRYRKYFFEVAENVDLQIQALKPPELSSDVFVRFANSSAGRNWQNKVLKYLCSSLLQTQKEKLSKMNSLRNSSKCIGCGACCRFACSEFSPDELAQKAQNGDNYASQFLSVFVPYDNISEVRKIFPEYLDLLIQNGEKKYYFYHCPKVTADNKCPEYESRPQICKDFPDNPLSFLPLSCGFTSWKLQSEDICLKLNAETEVLNFYIAKIKETQK